MADKTIPHIPVPLGGVERNFSREDLAAVAEAVAALSPVDRNLLAAVQESPHRLTTPEQFREFRKNTDYFVLEPGVKSLEDVGRSYLSWHTDGLIPAELLKTVDPVPFGKHAMEEDHGCFTSRGYLSLSGDEWEHEKPLQKEAEKKPSIRERLEQGKKECAVKAPPHDKGRRGPEL